jgi:hypothetical protein
MSISRLAAESICDAYGIKAGCSWAKWETSHCTPSWVTEPRCGVSQVSSVVTW